MRLPRFVPAFVRPMFCEGKGPFRSRSGPEDILKTDRAVGELFPEDERLLRWLHMAAEERVVPRTLGASAGSGTQRPRRGCDSTRWSRAGSISAPIASGATISTAGPSPRRPGDRGHEGRLGRDRRLADPNALTNTAAGAHWVSVHHGGGVGIGMSIHAGMVVVADGSENAAARLERVLTTDPGTGVVRHADAGCERALEVAAARGVRLPWRE